MKQAARVLVFVAVAAALSLPGAGCQSDGGTSAQTSLGSDHPKGEHPKAEHPKSEHPKGEHPKGEKAAAEHPAAEDPG